MSYLAETAKYICFEAVFIQTAADEDAIISSTNNRQACSAERPQARELYMKQQGMRTDHSFMLQS